MITDHKCGVWSLKDFAPKIKADKIDYTDGCALYVWGNNTYGQLGQNSGIPIDISSPIQVPGLSWCQVGAGDYFSFGIKIDGTLWAWGLNQCGALGIGNIVNYSSPVQIPGINWRFVSATGRAGDGIGHAIAIKSDGSLWSWGYNGHGQLGQNNRLDYSSPVQVPGLTWCLKKPPQGEHYTGALKTDGTLWTWGQDRFGNLGLGDRTVGRSSPVQIPGTTWCHITYGQYVGGAIKTNGTLWTWGNNRDGQVGNNTAAYVSSPVQIPGTTWCLISGIGEQPTGSNASTDKFIALKTDNSLWSWGDGRYGELGNNAALDASSPVQIPGLTWCDLVCGGDWVLAAFKTNATLWAWGDNSNYNNGTVGDGTILNRSSPVQIPGFNWRQVTKGTGHTLALTLPYCDTRNKAP